MRCVLTPPNSGGTLRTLPMPRTVRAAVVAVALVVVAGLPVSRGQNHSLDYKYLPHLDDRYNEKTNVSQGFFSPTQINSEKYFKCRCEGNQAWNGSGCVDTQTTVTVMNPDTGITVLSLTDDFAGVTVRDVHCSWDHVRVDLDPNHNPTNQFTLLPNGVLSWQQREYEHYCIDHTLDPESLATSWEAHVCLPPPVVPRCCPQSLIQTQGDSLSCGDDNSAYRFSPPIKIDDMFVKWPEVSAVPERKCKQNEKVLNLPLNTGESHLSYESGAVSIVWTTPYYTEETQQEGFCVWPQEGGGHVATICQEDQGAVHRNLCANVTCVRKCCPEGEIHSGRSCVAAERDAQLWKPSFAEANLLTNITPPEDLIFLHGLPHCSMYVASPVDNEDDTFYLLENGDLFTPASDKHDSPTRYCVDNFINTDNKISTKALICFAEEHVEPVCAVAKNSLYPALMAVSSAFLGATLVIYLTVPDLRNKLHGRCLISLASAFFVAYILMSISFLSKTMLDPTICNTLAFFKHFSLLAAFFWLNVMCFDIWRTLRKTRAIDAGRRSLHRFLWYSLYAWGCSLIIAIAAVVVDQLPASSGVIKPNFNNMFCWFSDRKSVWIYFYLWVSLILVANIIFFALVIVILVKGQNNSMLRRSRDMNRERMWLYVKLFLIMGVTWVTEVVSYQHGKCVEWLFTDIINALEGFILFLVFILNRSTLRKIRAKWGCGTVPPLRSQATTTTTSISSYHSKRQDSVISSTFKSSVISRKYSTTSSTLGAADPENVIPLNTVSEAPDESSDLEPRGHNPQPSDWEEKDTSRVNNGGAETVAIMTRQDAITEET